MMRINKYLSRSGVASRRKSEDLVTDGKIIVNDKIMTDLSYKVSKNDIVKYNGEIVSPVDVKYYIMLNKPIGYACTNSRKHNKNIIYDLIDLKTKLFSIGRLDKDSRGLILVTNDGDIYNKVIHPRNEIFKKYIVKINKPINLYDVKKLENGIDIGDYITNKSKIKILKDNILEVQINEGKNRQIRRMFAALNYDVIDLNRVSIGEINLGNLDIGKYRYLSEKEINYLRNL